MRTIHPFNVLHKAQECHLYELELAVRALRPAHLPSGSAMITYAPSCAFLGSHACAHRVGHIGGAEHQVPAKDGGG